MTYLKAAIVLLALFCPFVFPWVLSAVVIGFASVLVPPVAVVTGVLTDIFYSTPSVGFPYATLLGAIGSVVAYMVHQFIKARIME